MALILKWKIPMSNIAILPNRYDWAAENVDSTNARLPVAYEQARQALAQCYRIDECKEWADKAEALASYARQRDDEELLNHAKKIQGRAIRRCGELLREIPQQRGSNQNIREGALPNVVTRESAASDAGLSEYQRKTALRVAAIPEAEFESQIEQPKAPTLTQLAEQGTKTKPKPIDDLEGIDPDLHVEATKWRGVVHRMDEFCQGHDPNIVKSGFRPRELPDLCKRLATIHQWIDTFTL
jgi:hypothetical protein